MILGLDLGVQSVGWAVIRRNEEGGTPAIEAGSYVYPEPGELEEGLFVSNRLKRGQKRRQRIQLRRKRQRMAGVLSLLTEHGLLPAGPAEREQLLSRDRLPGDQSGERPYHPFMLRARGLDEELSLYEFGRCLHHITRRRGYMSTRDLMSRHLEEALPALKRGAADLEEEPAEEGKAADKETSALLGRLRDVRQKISAGEARTIGEFCALRLADTATNPGGVRASGKRREGRAQKQDLLGWRSDRFLVEEEFERLWDVQARFHPAELTEALRAQLRDAMFYQRPLASKKGLVGGCEFLPARKRLARAALTHQRCSVLQTLHNLNVVDQRGAVPRRLTPEEVVTLADALEYRDALTWEEARTVADMPLTARFSDEPDRRKPGKRTKTDILGNRTSASLRASLGDAWSDLPPERQEALVDCLLNSHDLPTMSRVLRRSFGFTPDQVRAAATAPLSEGYSNHCLRVWRELEGHMRRGCNYFEACAEAGYRQAGVSTEAKPEQPLARLGAAPDLRNPVVQRSVKMAFRVINAVIDKYGKPTAIRIELPRDVARTNKQREEMWKQQDKQARARKRAADMVAETLPRLGQDAPNERVGARMRDRAIEKVLLWEEAGRRCPYEPDREVSLVELLDHYEVEHIVPRSRCWDDSWMNKTICPVGLNMEKGNRTPFEWLRKGERWDHLRRHVGSLNSMSPAKRRRIVAETFDDADFTNRALSDTRYLSVAIKKEVARLGVTVEVSKGQITSQLRSLWDLGACIPIDADEQERLRKWRDKPVKKDAKPRFDHRHHALDAVLTALTDIRTLQRMTAWFQEREKGMQRNRIDPPKLWPTLTEDLMRVIDRAPVVHVANRGVGGELHKQQAKKEALPAPEVVAAALVSAGPDAKGRPRRTILVQGKLVRLGPDGRALQAFPLEANHHACVWERVAADGSPERSMTLVTLIEASGRASRRQPIIQKTRDGWRFVLSICNQDLLEWTGDKPGVYLFRSMSITPDGKPDLWLSPPRLAAKVASACVRVRSNSALLSVRRRVCLGPLGDETASEPTDA